MRYMQEEEEAPKGREARREAELQWAEVVDRIVNRKFAQDPRIRSRSDSYKMPHVYLHSSPIWIMIINLVLIIFKLPLIFSFNPRLDPD